MIRVLQALALVAFLSPFLAPSTHAQDVPLEPEEGNPLQRIVEAAQWTPRARLALAQALWGEAGIRGHYTRAGRRLTGCDGGEGCHSNLDWRLIPWVLATRWSDLHDRGNEIEFETLIRAYCASVKPRLASSGYEARVRARGSLGELPAIRRRRFLLAVRWDGSNLDRLRHRYGHRVPSDLYREGWSEITSLVEAWGRGEIPNECPAARHWDHAGARPSYSGLRRVDCGETLNVFYCVQGRSCPATSDRVMVSLSSPRNPSLPFL